MRGKNNFTDMLAVLTEAVSICQCCECAAHAAEQTHIETALHAAIGGLIAVKSDLEILNGRG